MWSYSFSCAIPSSFTDHKTLARDSEDGGRKSLLSCPATSRFRSASRVPFSGAFYRPKTLEILTRVPASRAAVESQVPVARPSELSTAADVVREFYDGINRRDLAAVEPLIGEECVYEDLIFSKPFVGRKAILEFFKKFSESISSDLQFVIDNISGEDTSAVGVTWHLDWQGRPFPFSKGCSFYHLEVLDGRRQIVYARDCVEPATKPGELALVIVRGVTWILKQFPQLADQL